MHLWQHLQRGGVEVVDPPEELPTGQEFMRQLPERARRAEETAFIIDIFEHVAQAHEHLSEVCGNVSALAKVTDKATLLSHHKRSHPPTRAAQHPRGVFEPDRRQEGQNNRGKEKREKVAKDGPAHPQCPLSGPRTSKRPHLHLDSSCVVEDVKEILQ